MPEDIQSTSPAEKESHEQELNGRATAAAVA
eukprot:CAMPEP_0174366510 /NCGR_PEP_ID=MMETSP0811_2-20130205/81482_1 /TAXON_ID=73025 ORGANISM="Eutreptiella gymnastica-like, Strain CCMP1594" /NCGR_SAMPLE_ID=MMETSP0811_2 /ASSEMBLY_ACC=CAM_ASM_000667 /LENGTH=30 /DNA_ID= /DNA_START= /DNA_END= /DNA_ORIENTATION=